MRSCQVDERKEGQKEERWVSYSVTYSYLGLGPGELLMKKAEGVEVLIMIFLSATLGKYNSCETKCFECLPQEHKPPLLSGVLK